MSAPDGTPLDRRHPSWCDPARCEAENTEILGDHRSRVMQVRARERLDNAISLWLVQPVFEPLATGEPWVFMQIEDRRINGELDSLATYSLRLNQGEDLAEALSRMVDLGRSGEPVDEEQWRAGGAS